VPRAPPDLLGKRREDIELEGGSERELAVGVDRQRRGGAIEWTVVNTNVTRQSSEIALDGRCVVAKGTVVIEQQVHDLPVLTDRERPAVNCTGKAQSDYAGCGARRRHAVEPFERAELGDDLLDQRGQLFGRHGRQKWRRKNVGSRLFAEQGCGDPVCRGL